MASRFVRCPAASKRSKENLAKSVINPVKVASLTSTLPASERRAFLNAVGSETVRIWAWKVTSKAKNRVQFADLRIGDIAFFYTDKTFKYYSPVVYKWESPLVENIVDWHKEAGEPFSLVFALGNLYTCSLSSKDYCTIMNYKGMPVHSEVHDEQASIELFDYIALPQLNAPTHADFEDEGEIKYRIQQNRERSDGNRLKVLANKGFTCEVCGFNFKKYYGSTFNQSANVHHLNPLALGTRRAKSVDEFAVLCAPCHTAVHMGPGRKLKPWTIDELKTKIGLSKAPRFHS
jgi:hypothetical protein